MRGSIDRDTPPAGQDASGERSTPGDDWTVRHARTRGPLGGTNVRVDDPSDDRDEEWLRRHGRTRAR